MGLVLLNIAPLQSNRFFISGREIADSSSLCSISGYALQYTDRDSAIVALYVSDGHKMQAIGDDLGLHYFRISKIVRNAERAKRKT